MALPPSPSLHCHVPIRVRVTGVPDEETLQALTRQVAAQVRSRLAAARRELPESATLEAVEQTHERYDAERDLGDGYAVPGYQNNGRPTTVPLSRRRPWIVLRTVNFRVPIGEYLDVVERVRGEELPAKVLYDDRAQEERWVEVWWVQVNTTTSLLDLQTAVNARAGQLSRLGPRQILADLITPFDGGWRELTHLDRSGSMRSAIPSPGERNQRRVEGNGQDAVVSHGGWVLYAFMSLPGISVSEVLDAGPLTRLNVPLPEAGFLVDRGAFQHDVHVPWERFAEEFASESVPVWVLAARVRRPTLAQAVYYLAQVSAREQRPATQGEPFISDAVQVLSPGVGARLPSWLARHVGTENLAPEGSHAARGVRLEAGWPVLYAYVEIPVGPDRTAAALQGPKAREIAGRIRALLKAGIRAERWTWCMLDELDEANAGGPPAQRPPGGTLAEHVLADLERTGDFSGLFQAVQANGYFLVEHRLLMISLPTRFADRPEVRALHERLAGARAARQNNLYRPEEQTVLLQRDPRQRWAKGSVLGDLDETYLMEREEQRATTAKAEQFRTELAAQQIAVMADIAAGRLARDLDDEAFAREVLARTTAKVPVTKDDVEDVTVQRSIRLLGVTRRDLDGLPSYDLRLEFVERVAGGAWKKVSQEFTETSGDFEARQIYLALGQAGKFYESLLIGISAVGLIAVAWEAGLVAVLVDLAGGATTVIVSIAVSELIYLLRVAFGDAKLTLRGFLVAALDGYLMALGFRLGAVAGRWGATQIGTATVRRVVAGWIAERLLAGAVSGAVSAGLERFAHDVIAVATGEGSWSGIGTYVKSMAVGAAVGVVAEFTLQPALHAVLGGGRTALESAVEIARRVRAEGISAVQFSAGVTEALANLRASLSTLAGDGAARGFAGALGERLETVLRELGASAIATRTLQLSGAKFSQQATEGLQRFLRASEASGNITRSHELATVFARHPQETVHFLEALATMDAAAAGHLAAGTFGSPQELAGFLGRIGRYEPGQQRAVVRLLGELGVVAADPVATQTSEQIMQHQLELSLRLQAAGREAEAANLRAQATRVRANADLARQTGRTARADIKAAEADELTRNATLIDARAAQARVQADDLAAGRMNPADVVPTSAELDTAFAALEAGTNATGGPQAWIRLPVRAVQGNAPVLERLVRPLFRSRSGHRVVFRVEGGSGVARSRDFVQVDPAGNVRLATGGRALNLNFGVFERSVEFLLENRAGARLKVFEVEEGWFRQLRGVSTPEQGRAHQVLVVDEATRTATPLHPDGTAPGITDVKGLPRIVDTRYGIDQLQVPPSLLRELNEFIVPGSGRVLEFTP
ncbi:hypothetical protein LWF15_29840 [Kineosporia rhizophila]|uniref:hypothetical protein n=1 Tax=Kineosporia TaxID=49184 RepID=UPI001E5DA2DE|nr:MULTISPECIES: hypothetical protein [Kineosporia]MCE0539709.1 hypothetical protein [Kineosporia rhizophila]GLY16395.1 hypothetical protein Kisp01_34100 [Kineosporia sp. NBRC 101677]